MFIYTDIFYEYIAYIKKHHRKLKIINIYIYLIINIFCVDKHNILLCYKFLPLS